MSTTVWCPSVELMHLYIHDTHTPANVRAEKQVGPAATEDTPITALDHWTEPREQLLVCLKVNDFDVTLRVNVQKTRKRVSYNRRNLHTQTGVGSIATKSIIYSPTAKQFHYKNLIPI